MAVCTHSGRYVSEEAGNRDVQYAKTKDGKIYTH